MAGYTDGEHGIWLVVPPSVGLPLFLGTVTLIALLVHAAILSNAHWFPKYWEGGAKVAAPAPAVTAPAVR